MELQQQVSKVELEEKEDEILPIEAIYEILTRVPVDALQRRCRLVCKDWQNLSYESNFIKLHCERTRTISGYFIQTLKSNKYTNSFVSYISSPNIPSLTLDFLPSRDTNIVASTHCGLLCCVSNEWHIPRYYICKPATKQWKQIPNPKTRYWTMEVAVVVMKPDPLHYKLIRLSHGTKYTVGVNCEIFDSNTAKWRRSILNGLQVLNFALLGAGPSVLLQGKVVHWLLKRECDNIVLAFDMENERWWMIELQQEMRESKDLHSRKQLVEYHGKLGIVLYSDHSEFVEIWAMENYYRDHWEKKDKISLEIFHKEVVSFTIPLGLYNAEVLLMMSHEGVVWYDYQRSTCDAVTVAPYGSSIMEAHSFQSDLVPWNLE